MAEKIAAIQVYSSICKIILIMFIVVFLLYLWKILWIRLNRPELELVVTILFGIIAILYIYPGYLHNRSFIGSVAAIDLLQVAAWVATIWGVRYVHINLTDCFLMTFILFCFDEFCNIQGFYNSFQFILGFTLLLIIIKLRVNNIKSISLQVVISFFCGTIIYILYEVLYNAGLKNIYYNIVYNFTRFQKGMVLITIALILVVLFCILITFLKRGLNLYFLQLQAFSEKYSEIGYYLLGIPYFLGIILAIIEGIKQEITFTGLYSQYWYMIMLVIFIASQVFYVKLLTTTIHLKEHIEYKEIEEGNLRIYNQDMTKNMQEIREMKHDLKNLFLTMGEYVARSEDEEFKEYYYEKIAPFARNEIRMNDLYVRLQEVGNESIKAFLYYKILQGINCNVQMQLVTELDHSVMPYISDVSDLTRVIGIFIDNAIEECVKQDQGIIDLVIKEKDNNLNFIVKNSVRESVRQQGIHSGITDKGLGRGNGLRIVEKMVSKHDDILWNYYFNDNSFVQSITITR